jgi:hypothetical protein
MRSHASRVRVRWRVWKAAGPKKSAAGSGLSAARARRGVRRRRRAREVLKGIVATDCTDEHRWLRFAEFVSVPIPSLRET